MAKAKTGKDRAPAIRNRRNLAVTGTPNTRGTRFHKGDKVGLTTKAESLYTKAPQVYESETYAGKAVNTATIEYFLSDARGYAVLNRRLGGYWVWNVNDLLNLGGKHV